MCSCRTQGLQDLGSSWCGRRGRCLFFFWCVCACVLSRSLCLTLFNPTNCSPPGSSVHGISQVRILEWVAISFSRVSSQLRDWTRVSCTGGQILYHWATREVDWRLTTCKPKLFSQKGLIFQRQTLTKIHTEFFFFTKPSIFLPHLKFSGTAKDYFSVWVLFVCVWSPSQRDQKFIPGGTCLRPQAPVAQYMRGSACRGGELYSSFIYLRLSGKSLAN